MRSLFLALTLLFCLAQSSIAASKVLIMLNHGYRPEEYFEPRKAFDAAGFDVKVAALYPGEVLPSRKHVDKVPAVHADLTFDKVAVDDYDAVVFVGGNGAWNEIIPNKEAHRILMDSVKKNKVTALICAATGVLATANNLDGSSPQFKGKHVTGYFEVEGLLKKQGLLNYDPGEAGKPFVLRDGKLITGRDPVSASLFAETVVKALHE